MLDVVDRRLELAAGAANHADETLLQRGRKVARFLIGLGCDDVDARHGVGGLQLLRPFEALAIDGERLHQRVGGKMRGEGIGQAELGGELGAKKTGPENPERDVESFAGNGADRLIRSGGREEGLQLEHVLREAVGRHRIATERPHGELVGAGRAAEAEIDAAGKERLKRAELLGDDEG